MRKTLLTPEAMICVLWKAVCVEMRLYSLRRGQQKSSVRNLAGALLHLEGGSWKRVSHGTSLAAYPTTSLTRPTSHSQRAGSLH